MNKINQMENQIQKEREQDQEKEQKVVNGVSVTKLFGTIGVIQGNPIIANFNFCAKGRWVNGAHNQTTINDFYDACKTHSRSQPFVFEKDEPPVLLGEDHGAKCIIG
jgi:hypothetical protein